MFCLRAALNKAKGKRLSIVERRGYALTGPFSASPDINRMPLLFGFRIFYHATHVHFNRGLPFNEFYLPPIFTISRNSGSARGITDKRD
jgi:hypothetical protein